MAFSAVSVQKSEHFRTLVGNAAGGVHRGGRIFEAPPLCRFLLVLFLAKQEKYIYCGKLNKKVLTLRSNDN